MTFYRPNPIMSSHLRDLINRFEKEGRPNLKERISIVWICYQNYNPTAGSGIGASWMPKKLFYPASIVKIIYGIAAELWVQKDLIRDSEELRRSLSEMIQESNNDATSYVVDVLTGTTSGPQLKGEKWKGWQKQRNLVNSWLNSLNWKEFDQVNCCQKTWSEGPYGREKDFYGINNKNRNAISTSAIARLFEALMTNEVINPKGSKQLKNYFFRSLDLLNRKNNPENQIDGFLGEGLPRQTKIWSKAGWMSKARHDVAWFYDEKKPPMLIAIFTEGEELSKDHFLLPALASELHSFPGEIIFE